MAVRLLRDIEDVGTKDDVNEVVGLKISKKRNKDWKPPRKGKDGNWIESKEPEFKHVPMLAGAIVEVSKATEEKWIKKGWAEAVESARDKEAAAAKPEAKHKK